MSATRLAGTTPTATSHLQLAAWKAEALWVIGFGVLGFALTGLLSSVLALTRDQFVGIYLVVVTTVTGAYLCTRAVDVPELFRRRWVLGLAGAAVMAVVMSFGVQRMDASPRDTGAGLVWDLVWLGVVYGLLDAVLLNVLPVVAVWRAARDLGHVTTWLGKLATSAVALLASLYVTAAYHLGYAEFRGSEISEPLVGNTLVTLGYLVTTNPITALVAHVALHVASVIHGVDATVTLPPHS